MSDRVQSTACSGLRAAIDFVCVDALERKLIMNISKLHALFSFVLLFFPLSVSSFDSAHVPMSRRGGRGVTDTGRMTTDLQATPSFRMCVPTAKRDSNHINFTRKNNDVDSPTSQTGTLSNIHQPIFKHNLKKNKKKK